MPRYTFTFKKDDIFVEFTTEDKDVVERQFQIWVSDADEYARRGKISPQPQKAADLPKETEEPKQEEEPAPAFEQPTKPEPEENVIQAQEEPQETEPVFDQASNLLKTINTIQNEENITTSLNTQETASVDFEVVLEKTIENPTFEPERVKDPVFLNLMKSKDTTDKFHYLMITAYYLSEFEKMERFSLKQINAKLMQNISQVIDHATLQDAINQNLLELVPDLTGVSEVGEYKITPLGEEFFINKI